jgi:hypothetical protein
MLRCCLFNAVAEELLLWAGSNVVGNFSFLSPFGVRQTLVDWRGDWVVFTAEYYLNLTKRHNW